MSNGKKTVFWLLMVFALGGCAQIVEKKSIYLANHAHDYLKSKVLPPLQVPPDLTMSRTQALYPLPEPLPAPGTVKAISLVPPGFGEMIQSS